MGRGRTGAWNRFALEFMGCTKGNPFERPLSQTENGSHSNRIRSSEQSTLDSRHGGVRTIVDA